MTASPSTFRDFGIIPDQLQPPPDVVRCYLSPGRIAGQYFATLLIAGVGAGLAALCFYYLPGALGLLGGSATVCGFGMLVYLGTRNDYRWIELAGEQLRARHLYTGGLVERPLAEVESLLTLVLSGASMEGQVIQALMGRVKGVQIQFRDGRTPLTVTRSDPAMTNGQQLIEAVVYRLSQLSELEPEIVDFDGAPLLRSMHRLGEPPPKQIGVGLKMTLGAFLFMGLAFGIIMGFLGLQEEDRLAISLQPPHEMTLAALIAQGPGANRHVAVTDFVPGGYVVETKNGSWSQAWAVLDPVGAAGGEIQAVFSTKYVADEQALANMLNQPRLIVGCSAGRRSSWGATLGPELRKSNGDRPLNAAWDLDDLGTPPSPGMIAAIFATSYACFGVALALALIVVFGLK